MKPFVDYSPFDSEGINYILALDNMAKQDPPMDSKSPEGEKFMLAVKVRNDMSMTNPKQLCNGADIIRQAKALVQEPLFEKFIEDSGKSVEDLRKTKSSDFAKQFSKYVTEFNAHKNKQNDNAPTNTIPVADKGNDAKQQEIHIG